MDEVTNNKYRDICDAVIIKACLDIESYEMFNHKRKGKRSKRLMELEYWKDDAIRFLKSTWLDEMTEGEMMGTEILRMLYENIDNKKKEYDRKEHKIDRRTKRVSSRE